MRSYDTIPQPETVEQMRLLDVKAEADLRLAVMQNIATNGRLFSALLVVISLTMMHAGFGQSFAVLAVLAALPVGLSCIADLLPVRFGRWLSMLIYFYTAVVAFIILLNSIG